jgi:hypothetical protein
VISPRHHAISLAAVFLALTVGVLLGSGLLSDTLLSGLREEKRDLHSQINTLTDQKNVLNEKLAAAGGFDAQMAERIVRGALTDKSVAIFRTPDSRDDDVAAVAKVIGQGGGTVTATVSLTQEFVDANSAEKLRTVVNSSIVPAGAQLSTKLVDQGSQAGDLLGIALLVNRDPALAGDQNVQDSQRDTVLAALRDTGFITYPSDGHVGAANAAIVITGGGLGDGAGNQGATVAGRDGSANGTSAVAVTRADPGMTPAVSTIDDVDAEQGRITAVLALQDLISGGRTGQYGVGHGATALTVAP